ncbi:putative serine protease PepD [Actinopolyspora biskrensis]|uniref:Putative serine protease PepD n=1 Tax=Actinopolyspora biskrensis TaxID=1470178 RepID=A0A852Z0G9_9ACTN|nr:trypsin-like peptidase domain-containing protein [Actinopolyspora biskrensis]NYH79289.1 putative serine protease PepD [Actinopolyspora biskrensis]
MTEQNNGFSEGRQEEPQAPGDDGSQREAAGESGTTGAVPPEQSSSGSAGEQQSPEQARQDTPWGSAPSSEPQGPAEETRDAGGAPPQHPRDEQRAPEQQPGGAPESGGEPEATTGGAWPRSPYAPQQPQPPQQPQQPQQPYGVGQPPPSWQQHPAEQPGAQQPGYATGPQQGYPTQRMPQGAAQYGTYPQGQQPQDPHQQGQYAAYQYQGMAAAQNESAPPNQRGGRGGRGRFVVGVTALAAVVSLIGGGVGSYAVNQFTDDSSAVTSFDQPKPASNTGTAEPGSAQAVANSVLPSVVQIQSGGAGGSSSSGSGSGIVISEDGYILTNNHVATAGGTGGELVARFNDGSSKQLRVVGTAPWADLAVVKADAEGLTPATLGRSDDVEVGSGAVAIGSPYGLSGTVTSGIISATDRPVRAGGESGSQATVLNALQTDAAINPGNSGGPLVNMDGQVIGINSAIYSPGSGTGQAGSVGLGFAIPVDQAKRIGKQLIEDGTAAKTTLGVTVDITGRSSAGALIVDVPSDGPAAKAGVEKGDVITKVNDRTITSGDELVAAVRSYSPGTTVTLTMTDRQGNNEHTVEATLAGQEQ